MFSTIYLHLLVLWCYLICESVTCSLLNDIDPDETRTFHELIHSRGFILQEHRVVTEDGYILVVHRVVPPDYDPLIYNVARKPVIAMHGIFNDATFYYFTSPFLRSNSSYCGDNFGFCMVLSGRYDLWVPNSRGNGRSMDHLKYTKKDSRFWRFSWDHMATFDLPAIIGLVQDRTGHRTMGYVCFSQGCAQMFALLSLQPHYTAVIRPLVAWAPAVYISRASSLIGEPLRRLHSIANKPGVFPIGDPMVNSFFQWHLCRSAAGQKLCAAFMDGFFGRSNLNLTRIPTFANFGPSISSNWQVAHFGQNGESGRFARFTYPSVTENILVYGRTRGPDYPLKNIPKGYKVLIMYGPTDAVVVPQDARKLIRRLRAYGVDVTEHPVRREAWSHADFLIGTGAGGLVYDHTVRFLDLHSWNY